MLHLHLSSKSQIQRLSTLALRERKAHLLRSLKLPPHLIHAFLLEGFLTCDAVLRGGGIHGDVVSTQVGDKTVTCVYVGDPEGNLVGLQSWPS